MDKVDNKKSKYYRYGVYRDEVSELKESYGYSSRKIAKIISEKYPDKGINIENFAKAIRSGEYIPRSIVDESLHRNNLHPSDNWKVAWIKDKETGTSTLVSNPDYKNTDTVDYDKIRDTLISDLKAHSPAYPTIKRNKCEDSYCLVLDPADIHIGKLATSFETGVDYNSQVAVKRVKEGVQGILDKSSGFNLDKIIFIGGNDILHTDTPQRKTTSGTPQDTDGMWYDNFLTAKQLYVDVLEMLISVADVEFVFNPSNHDYMSGFMLADVIKTQFRLSKNISFDCSISHRKYSTYGNSLIGTTHGDGAKQVDLGQLMSVEAKEHWATSEHRYFYTHHVHHKTAKDYINVTVESLRSPSPADSWHHRNGYVNKAAVEGFIHSKTQGQVARLTHFF